LARDCTIGSSCISGDRNFQSHMGSWRVMLTAGSHGGSKK
jgi:hypothetical protein